VQWREFSTEFELIKGRAGQFGDYEATCHALACLK
jgi:hypothetical protein